MNDSHDSGAVGRLTAYLDAWDRCFGQVRSDISRMRVDGELHVLTDHDLRAVLAENEAMRQQLAALKTEWEVRVERPGRPRTQGTFNAARIAHGAADAIRQAEPDADISVHSRLVGEWRPAEGGAAPGPERLTPDTWCERYGLDVRDPDGWRTDGTAWDKPITLPDFWARCCRSTARIPVGDALSRIVADVRAAKTEGAE